MGHLKVGTILSINDNYRIGKKVVVRVTNISLYPKAETGPRFEAEILSGGSFRKENFRECDITRNFGIMTLDEFKEEYPEKLI